MNQSLPESNETLISDELVMNQIYKIRGLKVMLDKDLAKLYGVETKVLNQAVRRNSARFPDDFMFELNTQEFDSLRSQIVTLKNRGTHTKYLPSAFTEQGVAMLSSVLRSPQAIQVNIQIIRIFTKLRQFLADNTEIQLEIAQIRNILEKHTKKHENLDKNMEVVFQYLDELADKRSEPELPRKKIGYEVGGKK